MRIFALAALTLLALPATAQNLNEAEARRLLQTPLSATVGAREAERIQQIAVLNGLLRFCRWRWEPNFERLLEQHRQGLHRPEAEMQRIVVWHGYWQGAAQQFARNDRPACDDAMQASLRDQAAAALRAGPQR
ncbi:hypothetical protein KTR66_06320 [Roseococcus sp. SDR]|uniref:hypothetical protein n=1 Tax=Roseococcus sp. SDR TaxID=2835532 RepID=UPI001BCCCAB7|nr:hypothetical protein [Roseococcus sp. SDR]MBS7789599.1 hypothetical protein [Roseococcus sp. SDR]MBV1844913.1 hypothetical protein [Roseococcus sp. SDR]